MRYRIAEHADRQTILDFIRCNWVKRDHIYTKLPALFDQEHRTSQGYNFLLAESQVGLTGLLGFLDHRMYDDELPSRTISPVLWITDTSKASVGVGVGLMRTLESIASPSLFVSINVSTGALPIYQRLGYQIGLMQHWVLVNQSSTPILRRGEWITQESTRPNDSPKVICRTPLVLPENNNPEVVPNKTAHYILEKYTSRLLRKYVFFEISGCDKSLLLIARIIEVNTSRVIRIVDGYGSFELLSCSSEALGDILKSSDCEYLDIVAHGLDEETLMRGGFQKSDAALSRYVPAYFEPYLDCPTELSYAYKSTLSQVDSRLVFFRGDSDQDRPNEV
jgi:hypothetical protein